MIDYSIAARPNPMDRTAEPKFYASAQCSKVMGMEEFAKHISTHGCVYSRADVRAILTLAVDCLREMLLNGNKVQLGDLGNFYISLNSEGTLTAAEFDPYIHVKSVNVNWERGADFENLKDETEFNQVAIRSIQRKVLKAVNSGETTVTLTDETDTETEE